MAGLHGCFFGLPLPALPRLRVVFFRLERWLKRCFGCCLFDFALRWLCCTDWGPKRESTRGGHVYRRHPKAAESKQPTSKYAKIFVIFQTYKRISSKRPAKPKNRRKSKGSVRQKSYIPATLAATTQKATWKAALSQQNQHKTTNKFGKRAMRPMPRRKSWKGKRTSSWCLAS